MIAPFWGDVDTRNGLGEVWYLVTDNAVYINWVEVVYFWAFDETNTGARNTFQLIITDGSGAELEPGNNVAFHYLTMDWTTGTASGGTNEGFGGSPATVGVNSGNDEDFIQIGRFNQDNNSYDGPFSEADGVDWLENQCFQFNVGDANNFPPIAQNLPSNNTVTGCAGTLDDFSFSFIAPEALNNFPTAEVNDCDGQFDASITYMDNVISEGDCQYVIARTWMVQVGDFLEMCTQTPPSTVHRPSGASRKKSPTPYRSWTFNILKNDF